MRRDTYIFLAGIFACGISLSAAAGEVSLSAKAVPKAVQSAIASQYPKAKIKGYSLESRSPRLIEVEMDDAGTQRSIIYRPDGSAIEVETVISPSALPAAVLARIGRKDEEARIVAAEMSVRDGITSYEVALQDDGDTEELVFDAHGKIISEQESDSDDAD